MASQKAWDEIPNVEEQTPLPETIKFEFRRNDDRRRMKRKFRAAVADGWMERAIGAPTLTRLKTRAVIKTEEELEAFREEMPYNRDMREEIRSQIRAMYDVDNRVVNYDPAPSAHPLATEEPVEIEAGDIVEVVRYEQTNEIKREHGARLFEKSEPMEDTKTYVVKEIDSPGVLLESTFGLSTEPEWWLQDAIVGLDIREKAEREYKAEKRRRYRARVEERKQTDMDTLMEEIVIPHARKWVNEVWPGGSVDVDAIDWFWNPQLTNAAGMAYYGTAVPESMASGRYAIGLAPDYYYQKGIDQLLEIVRHELIHQWQYQHPDGKGGHGPKFKQWMDDMDTHRHCKRWSKETEFSVE